MNADRVEQFLATVRAEHDTDLADQVRRLLRDESSWRVYLAGMPSDAEEALRYTIKEQSEEIASLKAVLENM